MLSWWHAAGPAGTARPASHVNQERKGGWNSAYLPLSPGTKPDAVPGLAGCSEADPAGRSARAGRGLAGGASLFTARLALRVFLVRRRGCRPHPAVRIGTAVVVLPLHHPILVAEELAMLDVLSGGRMEVGIGSGYQRQEFDGLGIDMNESRARFREAVEVIKKAWTEETLTFHGQYTHVDNLWVLPKPVQKPHPPLYVAISTSPATVEWAASQNIQPILGGPTNIMGQAPQVLKMWRDKMAAFGHPHAHLTPPLAKGYM